VQSQNLIEGFVHIYSQRLPAPGSRLPASGFPLVRLCTARPGQLPAQMEASLAKPAVEAARSFEGTL
jgi:hypothetical protein